MILDQLTLRRPQTAKARSARPLRAQISKKSNRAQRKLVAAYQRQYRLTNALSDVKAAALSSEDITLGTLIVAAVASYALLSTMANLLFIFMQTTAAFSTWSGLSLGLLAVMTLAIFICVAAWIMAWGQNMLSISILESANRKQQRSIRSTVHKSLRHVTRLSTAWLLVIVLTFAPVAVIASVLMGVLYMNHVTLARALPYLIATGVMGISWIGYAVANYALVPKVALFEPSLPLLESFGRSRRLVKNKGRLFLLCNYFVLVLALAAAYGLSALLQALTQISNILPFLILVWGIFSLNNTVMTAFYRKRKLARK